MLLELCAPYKQGDRGDVQGERPGGFDFVAGMKYDAWAELEGASREDAQRKYVGIDNKLKSWISRKRACAYGRPKSANFFAAK